MITGQISLPVLDTGIVIAYIVGILVLGIWSGYRRKTSSTQLFLAGRSLPWTVIGPGLFCANISTIHLVGLAADGHRTGLGVGNFEWGAAFCLIVLGMVFAPFYFRSKLSTLPEYVEKRYCPLTRTMLAAIFILSALLVHIAMSLYAGATLLKEFFGFPVYFSIIGISTITAIYTILGGLRAVMITNLVQVVLLLFGSITLTALGIWALPEHGIESFAQLKAAVSPDLDVSMVQPIKDAAGKMNPYSWLCVIAGYPILGIWYWCTDQTIVQNILAAKSEKDGRDGAIFGGFLKILPVFIMVFPGVLAFALYHDQIGSDHNATLMVMMKNLLPVGLLGLFAAGLLAALMSTVEAALNSTATLASSDILKRIKPDTKDRTLVWVGRVTAGIVILLAMAWSTQGGKFASIFEAINKIPMMFAPAITTIFLLGVFWKRGTSQAAVTTLLFNLGIGVVYLIIDIPLIGSKQLIAKELGIPFMLAGGIIFVMCVVVYIIVTFSTPAPAPEKLENLSWKHPLEFILYGKIKGITDPRIMSAMLFVLMIVLYYFLR
ncbi:MAG: sodium:solute symporter family transporter [Planctomycetota bacterium]|jgi:SSS family solute:Na+ symporter